MICKHKNKVNDSNFCLVACAYCTLEQQINCEKKEPKEETKKNSCEDCVHCEVCKNAYSFIDPTDCNEYTICRKFKPKSRFVELPCEVGQTVWIIGVLTQQIVPSKTMSILYNNGGFHFLCENGLVVAETEQLGKTVFLSREEAENALQRKEDEGK